MILTVVYAISEMTTLFTRHTEWRRVEVDTIYLSAFHLITKYQKPVADPGFPVGGRGPRRRGA